MLTSIVTITTTIIIIMLTSIVTITTIIIIVS